MKCIYPPSTLSHDYGMLYIYLFERHVRSHVEMGWVPHMFVYLTTKQTVVIKPGHERERERERERDALISFLAFVFPPISTRIQKM